MRDRSRDREAVWRGVGKGNGVAAVSMGWLREQYNGEWGRLSIGRAAEISKWLTDDGVAHLPSPMPSREAEDVLLYKRESPIGLLIRAARMEPPFAENPVAAAYFLSAVHSNSSTGAPDSGVGPSTDPIAVDV
ncbi:hypothetical protein [Streptomyces chrestomyceticus]|uniref:hypothetical protein n=1 Tax=Streptomyces chrestomyceticus TaxID=68185 RepID=UPI0019D269DA|nr:hypothetical protein [Streptomyces chrestomyceticus]